MCERSCIHVCTAVWLQAVNDVLRLWYHESCRVFHDRLINDQDRSWFTSLLKDRMDVEFRSVDAEFVPNN